MRTVVDRSFVGLLRKPMDIRGSASHRCNRLVEGEGLAAGSLIGLAPVPIAPDLRQRGLLLEQEPIACGFQGRPHQGEDRSWMATQGHSSAGEKELIGIEIKQESESLWRRRVSPKVMPKIVVVLKQDRDEGLFEACSSCRHSSAIAMYSRRPSPMSTLPSSFFTCLL